MTTAKANERLANDLKTLMHDAQELMKVTAGAAGEKVTEMRDRLTAAIETAKENCEQWEENTVAAAKATDRTIREHPYESIGIAFGVGLLLGFLIRRK